MLYEKKNMWTVFGNHIHMANKYYKSMIISYVCNKYWWSQYAYIHHDIINHTCAVPIVCYGHGNAYKRCYS